MAFFGLTALGMQNPFAQSSDTINHFHVFTDDDFKAAFQQQKAMSPDHFSISFTQLPALMERVYHGEVPKSELTLLEKWVAKVSGDRPIHWHKFLEAVRGARQEAEALVAETERRMGPSCETFSCQEYQTNLRKCKSVKRSPHDKQEAPLTAQQEIGWEQPVSFGPRYAKNSSDETKFASEMIRFGVYY